MEERVNWESAILEGVERGLDDSDQAFRLKNKKGKEATKKKLLLRWQA